MVSRKSGQNQNKLGVWNTGLYLLFICTTIKFTVNRIEPNALIKNKVAIRTMEHSGYRTLIGYNNRKFPVRKGRQSHLTDLISSPAYDRQTQFWCSWSNTNFRQWCVYVTIVFLHCKDKVDIRSGRELILEQFRYANFYMHIHANPGARRHTRTIIYRDGAFVAH